MGNNLTGKEILGIYAADSRVSYYCVKKGFSRVKTVSPGQGLSFAGDTAQGGIAGLREILKKIKVDSGRKIFLALPRSMFFARDVTLPAMPVEDAVDSIKNSISIYSHLPHGEIYYDIFVTPSFKDNTRCLFLYCEKKTIDKYRDMFRETGHINCLVSVFPVSYGICAWMQNNDIKYPAGVLLEYGNECEFSVFEGRYWLSSVIWNCADQDNGRIAFRSVISKFPEIIDNLYRVNTASRMGWNHNESDDFPDVKIIDAKTIDALSDNLAKSAIAPAFCKIQQISLDEKPVKLNFVKPLRYILTMACIIALFLFYITGNLSDKIKSEQFKRDRSKQSLEQLQKKIDPVQNRVSILKKAASVKEDAELFLRLRPDLYTYVNEISRLVPAGTWFSAFYFYNRMIHLNAYSKDALATVRNLRKSKLFSKVRIKGPVVNRGSSKKEQFSLELILNSKHHGEESIRGPRDG